MNNTYVCPACKLTVSTVEMIRHIEKFCLKVDRNRRIQLANELRRMLKAHRNTETREVKGLY